MGEFTIEGRRAILGVVSLSAQHHALGPQHYAIALGFQKARVEEEFADVMAWVYEHAPNAVFTYMQTANQVVEDQLEGLLNSILRGPRHQRDLTPPASEQVFENHVFSVTFPTDEDMFAFKMRWD